jgi:biopolymer transport protein ExbD
MFLGTNEPGVKIDVPTDIDVVCSCDNSPLFLKLDSSGLIRHKNQIVSIEEIIHTVTILRNNGWFYSVHISASPDTVHNDVVGLSNRIQRQFPNMNVVWRVDET